MQTSTPRPIVAGLLALGAIASACRATTPRAPAAAPFPASASAGATPTAEARAASADVRFMQHMLAHHAQAIVMTDLVPERSRRDDIRLLAERIAISQRDEMALMQRLLRQRGGEVPGVDPRHAHHGGGDTAAHASMPGMLTPQEIERLTSASGAEFERLFLQYMIRHHEGALAMVAEYFATPGAARDAEIFSFASDIDADQRAEIRRMRTLQSSPAAGTPRR
jgi:uncharacterized protein (DUF305 family)